MGRLTFVEVASLHDFLKYGQDHTLFPFLAPGPDAQSNILSDLRGCAVDGICNQCTFALDDIFIVLGSVAENSEGFAIRANAVSANLDWPWRRRL